MLKQQKALNTYTSVLSAFGVEMLEDPSASVRKKKIAHIWSDNHLKLPEFPRYILEICE